MARLLKRVALEKKQVFYACCASTLQDRLQLRDIHTGESDVHEHIYTSKVL